MTNIIMVGNNKGGPGKTSACVNLACALARQGRRVAAADMDPQGNLTRRLRAVFDPLKTPTISEVIEAATPGAALSAMVPCGFPVEYAHLIKVICAQKDLTNRANEWHVPGAVDRLRESLTGSLDDVDDVLMDTAPGLGLLQQTALVAASGVLIVVQPEKDAMDGAADLADFVAANARKLRNPDLYILGLILSMVRPIGLHASRAAELDEVYGADLVWKPAIPDRTAVKEAHEAEGGAVPVEFKGRVGQEIAGMYDLLAARYLKETGAA
jgi:chromosome partitioning protein